MTDRPTTDGRGPDTREAPEETERAPVADPDREASDAGDAGDVGDVGDAPPPSTSPRRRRVPGWLTRKRAIWGGVALAAVLLLALLLRPAPLPVETAEATRGPLETTVDSEGVTRVRDRYEIAAPVTGRLQRVSLDEGDGVGAGTVVARITPTPLDPQATQQARARVAAAEAALGEARTRVAQTGEAYAQAARTTARWEAVEDAGGLSRDRRETFQLERASAAREHEASRERERVAAAEVGVARAALIDVDPDRATGRATVQIRAPEAGRVLRVRERSDRVVAAGTPLLEIGNDAALEVVVDVLSTDAVRIVPGARIRLVEWGGSGDLEARVRLVEPAGFTKVSALGVEEQRVNVVADLLSPPAGMGDGYRVEARVVVWRGEDVLRVPVTALFREGDEWRVFVVDGRRARLREVTLGHRGVGAAEVTAGLAPGERVVLFPSDQLRDGARVRAR
jgi:HlyD family secretion protein